MRNKKAADRWQKVFDDAMFEHLRNLGFLPPAEIECMRCLALSYHRKCWACSGTGRDPIPFSEVWGI